jgi:hypothetical protein
MLNSLIGIIASSGGVTSTNSYESIATVTASGSATTITFSSIPSTYQHLQVRGVGSSTSSGGYSVLNINGDTGSNYKQHWLQGDGSGTGSGVGSSATSIDLYSTASNAASIQAAFVIDILDYTSTNKNKTIRSLAGVDKNGSGTIDLDSGLYFATPAAITSLTFTINAGNWRNTSQFALYGIKG